MQSHSPNFVFLCETRQKASKMRKIRRRLGLQGYEGVDSNGMSGGLALYWHDSCQVILLGKYDRYIDVAGRTDANGEQWRLTGIYGEPRVENRQHMWEKLQVLRAVSDLPWLVIGDFNEAMWQHEHLSRTLRSETQMLAFRDCLLLCELEDLGFSGIPYTYNNGQEGNRNVQVRLDRACADEAWRDLFPSTLVVHLATPCSDHSPVLILMGGVQMAKQHGQAPRYEIMWERHPALAAMVEQTWKNRRPIGNLGAVREALN